jgi:hypothetical protein
MTTPTPHALEVARVAVADVQRTGYTIECSHGGYTALINALAALIDRERAAARRKAIEECAQMAKSTGHTVTDSTASRPFDWKHKMGYSHARRDIEFNIRSLLAPHTPPAPLTGEALEALRAEMAQDIADDEKEADAETALFADYGPRRCRICGWHLALDRKDGCVAGDCSYRPAQGSDEWSVICLRRRHFQQVDMTAREADRG